MDANTCNVRKHRPQICVHRNPESHINAILLVPQEGKLSILLKGDLAGMLTLAFRNGNRRPTGALTPPGEAQVSLVAGAGFEPAAFRL